MLDITTLIDSANVIVALLIIGLMVYAETGFLLGLFLPGDTLLLLVGVFAARGELPLWWSLLVIFMAAILGDNTGYFVGRTTGNHIFKQHKGLLFRQDYINRAEQFYEKHGGKTIIIARFIGYVRTIAPVIAGVAHMYRPKFIVFNIAGAALWTLSFVLLGYWLGVEVGEQIQQYFVPTLILGALLVVGPSLIHIMRSKQKRRRSKTT
ncbi:MAG TPA: DedA family protein [Candidatus Saccharimonadales bacterium]|nr:DedA family protein [Candidatus Saccharimonadales bacterium]